MNDRDHRRTTHGRYVARTLSRIDCDPHRTPHSAPRTAHRVLVGFHGYAEERGAHLDRLKSDSGQRRVGCSCRSRRFTASIGGRSEEVVASWMTRQDRELMIADNIAYVSAVLDEVVRQYGDARRVVFAGFSQGVATAFRAACRGSRAPGGVIALGGDMPPDLISRRTGARPRGRSSPAANATTGRPRQKLEADRGTIAAAGVNVSPLTLDGGHEWTRGVQRARRREFLQPFRRSPPSTSAIVCWIAVVDRPPARLVGRGHLERVIAAFDDVQRRPRRHRGEHRRRTRRVCRTCRGCPGRSAPAGGRRADARPGVRSGVPADAADIRAGPGPRSAAPDPRRRRASRSVRPSTCRR